MQTFLPYSNFEASVKVLDWRRLGKQRVEAWQFLKVLRAGTASGWARHPAVLMWRGFEEALELYKDLCIVEWVDRGYNNTMSLTAGNSKPMLPPWLGDDLFHASHQSSLLRKDSKHYGMHFSIPPDLPYQWPVLANSGKTYVLRTTNG